MKLVQVSRYFDRSLVTDPVTGDFLFKAQFSNYDGSKRDAFTAYRRIMSLSPELTIPPARVIRALGETWIVGDGHPDGWKDLHRRKFVTHKAAGPATIWSLADFMAARAPRETYGDLQWVVDRAEEEVSSLTPQMFVAILPDTAEAPPHSVIQIGSDTMFVQSSAHHASGFLEARGYLQSGSAARTVDLVKRVFNPATGGYTNQTTATVRALKVRWQELYEYANQLDERFQEGDATFVVPPGTAVDTSTSLVHEGRKYTVLAVKPLAGGLAVHSRPAA